MFYLTKIIPEKLATKLNRQTNNDLSLERELELSLYETSSTYVILLWITGYDLDVPKKTLFHLISSSEWGLQSTFGGARFVIKKQ